MKRHICRLVGLLLICALTPSLMAFSGNGSREYRLGLAYLMFNPEGTGAAAALRGADRDAAAAMSELERFEKAIEHLERAAECSPSSSEETRVNNALRSTYNKISIRYDRAGQKDKACETAQKAVDLNPDDPVLWYNLAMYQQKLGNTYESVHSFEKSLEYAGENSIKGSARTQLITVLMQKALAEDKGHMNRALELIEDGLWENRTDKTLLYKKAFAYYQLGEFDRAIEAFEELAQQGPLTKGQQSLYDEAKNRQAAINKRGEIVEERAGFKISFDEEIGRDDSYKNGISDNLADARDGLSSRFDVPTNTTINVFVHRAQEFQEIHKNRPIAGTCRLNRIDLRIQAGLELDKLKNTVFHEFTHYLVTASSNCGSIPVWFNEGLAQHFEPNINWRTKTIRGLLLYNSKRKLSIEEMDKIQQLPRKDFFRAYVQSFFQVRYLIELNGEERVISILENVAGGKSFEDSFQEVIGKSQEEFFEAWRPLFREMLIPLRNQHVPDWKEVKRKLRERARARKNKN